MGGRGGFERVLAPLQVIWIADDLIRPPGPKMVACLCPMRGLFARINTKGSRSGGVLITQADHPFLRHDSSIKCGGLFELDDYVIGQSLRQKDVIGAIFRQNIPARSSAIATALTLREKDKQAAKAVLKAL